MLPFLPWTPAVVRLDPRLQIPLAVCHYHLRNSRYPDDRAIAERVRGQTIYGLCCAHVLTCHRKDKIIWECNHGGQIWSTNAEYAAKSSFPVGFCSAGFNSLNVAFIIGLLVDLVFQVRSHTDQML